MKAFYDGIREAADNMDCDALEDVIKEISDYAIPENQKDKFNSIKEMVDNFDYDGILEILDTM